MATTASAPRSREEARVSAEQRVMEETEQLVDQHTSKMSRSEFKKFASRVKEIADRDRTTS
jgi:hypothetical protein